MNNKKNLIFIILETDRAPLDNLKKRKKKKKGSKKSIKYFKTCGTTGRPFEYEIKIEGAK